MFKQTTEKGTEKNFFNKEAEVRAGEADRVRARAPLQEPSKEKSIQ